jgi:diacylglycerol kinase
VLEPSGLPPRPAAWTARAGRRGVREKLGASLVGLKHALRGDSSFFAHTYRFLLIALFAAVMGIGPLGWLLLLIGAALIFMAELTHSAVDTLARALGDPEQPGLKVAREIATAGVLVAVFTAATIWITVLVLKLGDLLGWWSRNVG